MVWTASPAWDQEHPPRHQEGHNISQRSTPTETPMSIYLAPSRTVRIARGRDAAREIEELAGFIDARSGAFTTSSSWLAAAARWLPGEPVVLSAWADAAPVALAALTVTTRAGVPQISFLGGEFNDYSAFYYDDRAGAELLAATLEAWVLQHRFWALALDQVRPEDAVLAALAARLPGAIVEDGPLMPRIEGLKDGYRIGKNRRQQLNNATNRLTCDGCHWEQVVVSDVVALERWLPRLIEVRRERDHGCGRRSHLDDPAARSFYGAVLRDGVARGRAVVNMLVVDGEVGGYAAVMIDGDTHRLFDGRVAERLQRYKGGVVADLMAVSHAIEAPGVTTFDWLRGESPVKFGNAEIRNVQLRAVSHPAIRSIENARTATRRRVREVLPESVVRRLTER